ncbi:hypothetical protein LLH23_00930 [bacterium]|nr:hypothetical protein [bacterium]
MFSPTPQEVAATPDVLPAGLAAVYAFYNLAETAGGGVVTATLSVDGKRTGAVRREDIRPDATRPGRGTVTIRAPRGKLAPGIYELELKTTRRRFRASFVAAANAPQILAQAAPAEAALALPQHGIALGVGPKGEPMRPTSRVGARVRVYYVVRYEGAEPGMAVCIRWWSGRTELRTARREVVLPSVSGWAHAWMQAADGLPRGTYEVTATTSGDVEPLARDRFTVE